MLKWSSKPDPVFHDILNNALESYHDVVKEILIEEVEVDGNNVFKIFGQKGLVVELERIITAHKSSKTYEVTDFHFLILYDVLAQFCDLYNDGLFKGVLLGGICPSQLDFEQIVDVYFWDTDFLFDQSIMNNLSVDQKDYLSISPVVFSIANKLTPHADELKISETNELKDMDEILYKDGKPYPYLEE